ncbi:hypothetical protein EVA_13196 [gut metagenome]|uniref:Uncharacterized protein n=1 Tax=gut metagenome TaxID=749906 RepID=J9FUP2_9ZZZZ
MHQMSLADMMFHYLWLSFVALPSFILRQELIQNRCH